MVKTDNSWPVKCIVHEQENAGKTASIKYDGKIQYLQTLFKQITEWYGIVELTSHSTHYRSFRKRFYGSDDPTNSVTHLRAVASQPRQGPIPPGSAH